MASPGKAGGLSTRLKTELKSLALLMLYFACWLVPLLIIKNLLLEEYAVPLMHISAGIVGALILSKVVLVLEHVSLGFWVARQAAWVDVLLRTLLYGAGVVVVLLIEKGFEAHHDHGGFVASLGAVFDHVDINHVWVNAIVISGALLVHNMLAVIRGHMGEGGLLRLFQRPPPRGRGADDASGVL